ncbi:hypothetical protein T492DRAFT_895235, partial [Pavlovales sp. CCMP2436]
MTRRLSGVLEGDDADALIPFIEPDESLHGEAAAAAGEKGEGLLLLAESVFAIPAPASSQSAASNSAAAIHALHALHVLAAHPSRGGSGGGGGLLCVRVFRAPASLRTPKKLLLGKGSERQQSVGELLFLALHSTACQQPLVSAALALLAQLEPAAAC